MISEQTAFWMKLAGTSEDKLIACLDECADLAGIPTDARPLLKYFLEDTTNLSKDELAELAAALDAPGSFHGAGRLATVMLDKAKWVDGELLAAIIARNWHGGKVGFQFLPDPARLDFNIYYDAAAELMSILRRVNAFSDGEGPERLLMSADLAFFESLPARFTVYRGAAGISQELAGAGLCWTTSRDIAEWFALRNAGFNRGSPVLLSARVDKSEVALVKASEFEVVVQPWRSRELKCRAHPKGWAPVWEWAQPGPHQPSSTSS